jgi:hypothetical protein
MSDHTDFDGLAITCRHLGLDGHAWLSHAWGDQYYCHVLGTWPNGEAAKGILCRANPDEIRPYLIPAKGDNGGFKRSQFASNPQERGAQ